MKILMVCLGNICRSPLAEGILQHKAIAAGLDWQVDSAGTTGHRPGCPPHELSRKVALLHGIDIGAQRCRQFTRNDIDTYDKIFVMDCDNLAEVQRISAGSWQPGKVSLVLDAVYPGQNREVPDPWYGSEKDYHAVFALLDEACDAIVEQSRAAAAS